MTRIRIVAAEALDAFVAERMEVDIRRLGMAGSARRIRYLRHPSLGTPKYSW